ncbi:hypothetical protein ACOME3_005001 [Neoechinorhynchus agilis]
MSVVFDDFSDSDSDVATVVEPTHDSLVIHRDGKLDEERDLLFLIQKIRRMDNPLETLLSLNMAVNSIATESSVSSVLNQISQSILPVISIRDRLFLSQQLELIGRKSLLKVDLQLRTFLKALLNGYEGVDVLGRCFILSSVTQLLRIWSSTSVEVTDRLVRLADTYHHRMCTMEFIEFVDAICSQAAFNVVFASLLNNQLSNEEFDGRLAYFALQMGRKRILNAQLRSRVVEELNNQQVSGEIYVSMRTLALYCLHNPRFTNETLAVIFEKAKSSLALISDEHLKLIYRLACKNAQYWNENNIRETGNLLVRVKSDDCKYVLIGSIKQLIKSNDALSDVQKLSLTETLARVVSNSENDLVSLEALSVLSNLKNSKALRSFCSLFKGTLASIFNENNNHKHKATMKLRRVLNILLNVLNLSHVPLKRKIHLVGYLLETINLNETKNGTVVVCLRKIARINPDIIEPHIDKILQYIVVIGQNVNSLSLIYSATLASPSIEINHKQQFGEIAEGAYSDWQLYCLVRECCCQGLFHFASMAIKMCKAETTIVSNRPDSLMDALNEYKQCLDHLMLYRPCLISIKTDIATKELIFKTKLRFDHMINFIKIRQSMLLLGNALFLWMRPTQLDVNSAETMTVSHVTFRIEMRFRQCIYLLENIFDTMFTCDEQSIQLILDVISTVNDLKQIILDVLHQNTNSNPKLKLYFREDTLSDAFDKNVDELKRVCSEFFLKPLRLPRSIFRRNKETVVHAEIESSASNRMGISQTLKT